MAGEYTQTELRVIRQAKVSGCRSTCEKLLDRHIPDAIWEALTIQTIDRLLKGAEPVMVFSPYNKRGK